LQGLTNPDVPGTTKKKMERDEGVTKSEGFRDQRKLESSPHQPHHQPEPKKNQQTSMWLGCSIPQCAPEIHGM
jgi:hypothetical protein